MVRHEKRTMKKNIYFLLFILPLLSEAQKPKDEKLSRVDSMVKAMRITTHDLEVLSDTLFVPFHTDSEKVRAIFYWMAENIAYDYDKYQAHGSNPSAPLPEGMNEDDFEYKLVSDIVKKRKAICGEYSMLFKYMCDAAHIKCEYITGYGKTCCLTKLLFLTGAESNHSWNAVMINGKWYLLDVTWAATCMINNGKREWSARNDFYYLCPPEKFIKDHHPDEDQWQLLAVPLTAKEWVKQACMK
jgi:transglutaminase/protease-like cytokinesis protein 3